MPRKLILALCLATSAPFIFSACLTEGDSEELAPRYGRADRMQYDTVHMQVEFNRQLHTIIIDLDPAAAPQTVENFKKNIASGFYRGLLFHRVINDFLVQTGDPLTRKKTRKSDWGTGGPGYTVPAEIGKKHVRGSIAMARLGDAENPSKASSGSQFYITLKPIPSLDGDYTVFGQVRPGPGLNVLDMISRTPADINDVPLKPVMVRAIWPNPPRRPSRQKPPHRHAKTKASPKPEGDPRRQARHQIHQEILVSQKQGLKARATGLGSSTGAQTFLSAQSIPPDALVRRVDFQSARNPSQMPSALTPRRAPKSA